MLTQQSNGDNRGPGRPRDEDARKRILKAASDLLESVGFGGVTVEAIAERAGASKATVYRWWPNKASVVTEAFRHSVSPDFPFAETGSLCGDVKEQLRRFSRFLVGRRGRLLTAFLIAAQSDQELATAFRDHWITPLRARGRVVLGAHQANGELPVDADLDLVMDMMYAPLYYNLLTGYRPISSTYAEAVTRAVLNGVRAAAGSRPNSADDQLAIPSHK
jgi:AcrR family transcriptional regulator